MWASFSGKDCWSKACTFLESSLCLFCCLASWTWETNYLCSSTEMLASGMFVFLCCSPRHYSPERTRLQQKDLSGTYFFNGRRHIPCVESSLFYSWNDGIFLSTYTVCESPWIWSFEASHRCSVFYDHCCHIQVLFAWSEGNLGLCCCWLYSHYNCDALESFGWC